ncbi:hypothetical protein BCV70DRAFT_198315 [Testicularia cyperi]|uniref:SART-1 protein n=1 Tax=Testicularia cyperi TaxID=1882483 RepID=A0A317XUS8_9BASI|nr:hypothetical protein BCV70DRAFT_198315 [Testicularia cyperi]
MPVSSEAGPPQMRTATTLGTASSNRLDSAASSSSLDTLKWLKQSKKRAKEHAARRAKELEAQQAREQEAYGASDLAGLRVAHDFDAFEEGEERVLTLRDTGVLDEADDELMDLELDQEERDRLNAERKKGLKDYSGLDDDEVSTGRKRSILCKYDADIPDAARAVADTGFRLGSSIPTVDSKNTMRKEAEEAARLTNRKLLSLDYAKNEDVSDYLQEGDPGFKKLKNKKRKRAPAIKARLDVDHDDEHNVLPSAAHHSKGANDSVTAADLYVDDVKTAPQSHRRAIENFVDDEELQASLAKSRRQKARRTFQKMTPETIARNLAAQKAAEEAEHTTASSDTTLANISSTANPGTGSSAKQEDDETALVFDETTEFVRSIRDRPSLFDDRASSRVSRQRSLEKNATPSVDVKLKREDSAVTDEGMSNSLSAEVQAAEADEKEEEQLNSLVEQDDDRFEDDARKDAAEPVVGRGVAGTLTFLRQQGMLPQADASLKTKEEQQKAYDAWLAARRAEESERLSLRFGQSASSSSNANPTPSEVEEARAAQERFSKYQPTVDIKYHDEFGRDLTSKEAWKRLSHTFHGKQPGTKKQEKRLRKIEEERAREKMQAGDTPLGMLSAFQNRTQRTATDHMVLSVGNHGAAPSADVLLGPKVELQKPVAAQKASGPDESIPTLQTTAKSVGGGWTKVTSTSQPIGDHTPDSASCNPSSNTADAAIPANSSRNNVAETAAPSASSDQSPLVSQLSSQATLQPSFQSRFKLAFRK